MSKLSKKMVKDFAETKKRSLQMSSCTQVNEQRMKEEYQDGRTVYKISKHRSISPLQDRQNANGDHGEQINTFQNPKENPLYNPNVNKNLLNKVSIFNKRDSNQSLISNADDDDLPHNLSLKFEKVVANNSRLSYESIESGSSKQQMSDK